MKNESKSCKQSIEISKLKLFLFSLTNLYFVFNYFEMELTLKEILKFSFLKFKN